MYTYIHIYIYTYIHIYNLMNQIEEPKRRVFSFSMVFSHRFEPRDGIWFSTQSGRPSSDGSALAGHCGHWMAGPDFWEKKMGKSWNIPKFIMVWSWMKGRFLWIWSNIMWENFPSSNIWVGTTTTLDLAEMVWFLRNSHQHAEMSWDVGPTQCGIKLSQRRHAQLSLMN